MKLKAKKPYEGKLPIKTLRNGDIDPQVSDLKMFLNWCIGTTFKGSDTFGDATEKAVRKFQSRYREEFGLVVDGIFGPASRAAAKAIVARHEPIGQKVLRACKEQADWMHNAKYGKYKPVTISHSKDYGTCVTYEGCVWQRLRILGAGQYVWHTGKGYGDGKVYGSNDKMKVMHMKNKKLKSLKSKIKPGDCILLDDNKSGIEGSGGHVFFCTGKWKGDDPYIWDQEPSCKCARTGKPRLYNGDRKVLAIVRAKG